MMAGITGHPWSTGESFDRVVQTVET